MVRTYPEKRKDPPVKSMGSRGFGLGLNQLTHSSVIKNNELAECFDAVFTQNGVIKKRQGSSAVGTARANDTEILGLQSIYNISGSDYVIRIGNTGIAQKLNVANQTWADITGSPTFDDGYRTYILQGSGYVYFLNEGNIIAKWDGTDWITFNALTNPTDPPTATKTGTGTGPRTYYYKYVWFNEIGHTVGSTSDNVASMPDTLDSDTFITVVVPTPPANTVKVGIFRGIEPGEERFLAEIPAADTDYEDKGQDEVDETYSVPESNTTSGYHFKFATVFKDTIIGVTTEYGDDTLVFSAGIDEFDNFGISAGGGFYSWRKGDGAKLVAAQPFKEQLYIFKTNKTGVFDFSSTTGAATVKDINLAVGGVGQDAIHPAGNDLRGWGQEGAFSMGNEPNFADVIRTKMLSARVQKTVDSITYSDISKIVSVYHKNLSIWALPTGNQGAGNNIMLVYDQRYAAWSIWRGMKAACFTKFIDGDNIEHLYYGDSSSGNVVEMFEGYADQGNAINFRISTKQFDAGVPYRFKTFNRAYFVFGLIYGTGTYISLVENGSGDRTSYILAGSIINQGFGNDQWGTMQFGESTADQASENAGIIIRYTDLGSRDLLSIQAQLSNSGIVDQVELMGIFFEYSDSEQPLPSTKKLTKITS